MDIQSLVKDLGGMAAVARICGVRPPSVHEWVKRGVIPADRCEQIEAATGGTVRCEDLRPDLEWIRATDGTAFYRERRTTTEARAA